MSQINRSVSKELYNTAKTYFPGGVNSPVRAFKSVGGTPLFIKKGNGPYLWDEDDNKYIDFCCSWGPLILGHNHPDIFNGTVAALSNGATFGAPTKKENELAALILNNIPFIDKLRFVSSGTEAVMSAIRLARGASGKSKLVKFEGCYHGHVDSLMVKAGSGLITLGTSSSAGVPEALANETIVLPLNDLSILSDTLHAHVAEIAAVIIEPIPANNGLLLQDKTFLLSLRALCTKLGILLIFDEVISGFRVAFGGAAAFYGITPDIVTYGKIMGGGLPVGAYGASNELMANISPEGPVYQAGTLSGNPVAMAAGIAQLTNCLKPNFYELLASKTLKFVSVINNHARNKGYAFEIFSIGSIFWLSFSDNKRIAAADQINPDMQNFNMLHKSLLEHGIYIGPSGYEVGFVSEAHSEEVLNVASERFCASLDVIFSKE
jgi:glutamate-1-semialdehyde 2,1-aminomutase